MDEQKLLDGITINPAILGGKPIARGRRIAVKLILGMLAAGDTAEEIVEFYPFLEKEDVQACVLYMHDASSDEHGLSRRWSMARNEDASRHLYPAATRSIVDAQRFLTVPLDIVA